MISTYLIESIKESEGFVATPYRDSLKKLTIGYGTLIEKGITKEEAHALLVIRLEDSVKELVDKKPIVELLHDNRRDVLFEMAYQLGVSGVLKFKKMWAALERNDYYTASKEMIDSKWYTQTPGRADRLARKMQYG